MRKLAFVSASLALVSAQAAAEVRPQDCRPVFPVVDQVAAVAPTDVIAEPAQPQVVPGRRFVGFPWLIPLIGLTGLIIIVTTSHHHHETVSPA